MKIGRFEIEYLSEGFFEFHGGSGFRKITPESRDKLKQYSPDINDLTIVKGVNPILVRDGKYNVLLDTGLGWGMDFKSQYSDTSNLKTNLDIFGLVPHDISHVVLSHLHYDHAAGASYIDSQNKTQATMAFADYYLQQEEWVFALSKAVDESPQEGSPYNLDEIYKLHSEGKLHLLNSHKHQLIPGIQLIHTGGHTPGHQIVKIQDSGETAYFLGDLIPDETKLNEFYASEADTHPLQAKKARISILRQAFKEHALLLFYHSKYAKHGYLAKDEYLNYVLREP